MIHGYARVSSDDQNLEVQEAALRAAGCQTIWSDKRSGTTTEGRAELNRLLELVRRGDTVIVTRIDRLARSIADLAAIVRTLEREGVALRATEQPIDTSNAAGRCFLQMLGVFAEFETNLRRERQLGGIARAKTLGRYQGRKRSIDVERVRKLREAGLTPAQIAAELAISRRSAFRLLADQDRALT